MWPVTPEFLAALSRSHTVVVRVDAYQGGRRVASDLPVTDGSVSVSAGSGVHRTLDCTIADPDLWETLAPVGTELRVQRGIRYPGGSEELCPLGVFSLDQQTMPVVARGGISISSAPDRWAKVQRGRFETSRLSEPALTNVQSIIQLVGEVAPSSPDTSGVTTRNTLAASKTVLQYWDADRDTAVTDMATAAGVEVFFGPTGNLVIRDVATLDAAPAWRIHAGQDGVLLAANVTRDRSRVFNVIVVTSSSTDGSAPYAPVIVEDTDPTSLTNVHGPYGRSPYFYTTALLSNAADARKAGVALLAKTRGRFVDMSVDALVNPALESGDTVSVPAVEGTGLYLADSFTVPLSTDGKQSLTLRSLAAVTSDGS